MEIELTKPLDMHLHIRDGRMLRLVAPLSAGAFAGAVIMPNLVPPVTDATKLREYTRQVTEAVRGETFAPLMTLFFRDYNEAELEAARGIPGFFGIKLYPAGITTNSETGVRHLREYRPTLLRMEQMGIPLLVHGESHGFVSDREAEFLPVYRRLAEDFPKLRICTEHITTAAALRLLDEYENLCATITLHHLYLTLDDLLGGVLRPHLFCKPIPKRPSDRDALLQAALSGHPRVMFGSDSAPHPRREKESCGCAAGVFSAPVALQALAALFTKHGAAENLQAFVSDNARRIYSLSPPFKKVVLTDSPESVPNEYRGYGQRVVPLFAGQTIGWSIRKITTE